MNKALEIKSRVTMPEILRRYGFDIDRHNRIACPLHGGVDRNCGVRDGYIHCFVCNKSADQIGLVQFVFGISFQEALKKIDEDFSLGIFAVESDRRRLMQMAQENFWRKKEQEKKQKEKDELYQRYWDALDLFVEADRRKTKYKPKNQNEEINPLFLEAVKEYDRLKYALGCAETELYIYEHAEKNS